MEVAWIGLGSVGLPTAKKIAAAGHHVKGYDVSPPAPHAASAIELVASPREAAQGCDLLCIAVFSDKQLEEVLTGPEGVLEQLQPGTIVAVFTTGSIETIRELAAAAPTGVTVLDTCFSRMYSDVATGTMTLLVGGEANAIERAGAVFNSFASKIVHVGGSGAGRAIKLVNNLLFAGHLQLAADALRFAEGLQLDPRATAAALVYCSGESDIVRRMAEHDANSILKTSQHYMVKDVAAAADAARTAGVDLKTLSHIVELYRAL